MGSAMIAVIMFSASIALITLAGQFGDSSEYRKRKRLLAEVPKDEHKVRAEYKCIRERELTDEKRSE